MKIALVIINQYRSCGQCQITSNTYELLTKVFMAMLDYCLRHRKECNAKKLMMFSLTFYKTSSPGPISTNPEKSPKKEDKQFLNTAISNHPIWKDNEFWAGAILGSIKEEYATQQKYHLEETETDEETQTRNKNIVYGQLGSYSRNMLIFNQEKTEVKNLIIKFCKLCAIPDKQVKDLNASIDSYVKEMQKTQKLSPRTAQEHEANSFLYHILDLKKPTWNKESHPLGGSMDKLKKDIVIKPELRKRSKDFEDFIPSSNSTEKKIVDLFSTPQLHQKKIKVFQFPLCFFFSNRVYHCIFL